LNHVALAVKTRNEHWAIVALATGLIGRKHRWLTPFGGRIAEPFTETALAVVRCASKEIDGVIRTEGRKTGDHGAEVLVTKR